ESLVLLLLIADVLADEGFIPPHRRHEVPAGPEVLADEIALPLAECPGDVDGALSLDVPDHVRDRILRRNRQQHVNVIDHQVPFLDTTLLLLRKRPEDRAEFPLDRAVDRAATTLRDEHDVILAIPLRMTEALVLLHGDPLRALGGSR